MVRGVAPVNQQAFIGGVGQVGRGGGGGGPPANPALAAATGVAPVGQQAAIAPRQGAVQPSVPRRALNALGTFGSGMKEQVGHVMGESKRDKANTVGGVFVPQVVNHFKTGLEVMKKVTGAKNLGPGLGATAIGGAASLATSAYKLFQDGTKYAKVREDRKAYAGGAARVDAQLAKLESAKQKVAMAEAQYLQLNTANPRDPGAVRQASQALAFAQRAVSYERNQLRGLSPEDALKHKAAVESSAGTNVALGSVGAGKNLASTASGVAKAALQLVGKSESGVGGVFAKTAAPGIGIVLGVVGVVTSTVDCIRTDKELSATSQRKLSLANADRAMGANLAASPSIKADSLDDAMANVSRHCKTSLAAKKTSGILKMVSSVLGGLSSALAVIGGALSLTAIGAVAGLPIAVCGSLLGLGGLALTVCMRSRDGTQATRNKEMKEQLANVDTTLAQMQAANPGTTLDEAKQTLKESNRIYAVMDVVEKLAGLSDAGLQNSASALRAQQFLRDAGMASGDVEIMLALAKNGNPIDVDHPAVEQMCQFFFG